MQNRISRLLALAVSIALLCNASIAAAAPKKTGPGAAPTQVLGAKKASKLGSLASIAQASATANPTPSRAELEFAAKAGAQAALMKRQPSVPGQMIVKYKAGLTVAAQASLKKEVKATTLRKFKNGAELVQLPPGAGVAATAQTLVKSGRVEYAQPNYIYQATSLPTSEEFFTELWGLENTQQRIPNDDPNGVTGADDVDINAPQAWSITMGSPEVVVAVMDTGIDFNHPDLQGRAWVNPGEIPNDNIDNDNNGYVDDVNGFDFYNWDGSVYDEADGDLHGTHVAGTIAANFNGTGVIGVAPFVRIASVKFLDRNGDGTTADALDALEYIRTMGFKLANHSWGGTEYDQALRDAFAVASETLHIVAAGNGLPGVNIDDNDPATPSAFPAAFNLPHIISVAAVNNQGGLASFSNYGVTSVDIAAPGVSILSTRPMMQEASSIIINDTGTYKSVVAGFGLEDIADPAQAKDLVDRVLSFFDATASTPITVVLDDASSTGAALYPSMRPYFEAALSGRSNVSYVNINAGYSIDPAALTGDPIVIWTTGRNGGSDNLGRNLTDGDLAAIEAYLNAGGNLFLTGQEAIWNSEDQPVVLDTLGVYWVTEGDPRLQVAGLAGTPFAGAVYDMTLYGANFHDTFRPAAGAPTAYPAMSYSPIDVAPRYIWGDGTSMAAPHVTGVAALVKTLHPEMNALQIKERILSTVVAKNSLIGKVASGGMVDANRAVAYSPDNDVPGVTFPRWDATVTDTLDGNSGADLDDVYSVTLKAGEKIEVWLDSPTPGTDFDLYLFRPGTETVANYAYAVAGSETWYTSTEYFVYEATEDGVYYIDAFGFQGNGTYNLRARWGNGDGIYEDNHIALKYSPSTGWVTNTDPNASGGTFKTSTAGGQTMQFPFHGSDVRLFAVKGPTMGLATVEVNGESTVIDLFSPTPTGSQMVFSKSNLLVGPEYTLTVTNKGMRSPQGKKSGIAVNVDRVEVFVDRMPPMPVSNLRAVPYDGGAELRWRYDTSAESDFSHFIIYRRMDGGMPVEVQRIYPTSTTAHTSALVGRLGAAQPPTGPTYWYFNDGNLENGRDYYYDVAAVDKNDNQSPMVSVWAHPDTAPAPVVFEVFNNDRQVTLTWEPSGEPDVRRYEIYREGPTDVDFVFVGEVPQQESTIDWHDFNVTNEETYWYFIIAVDQWNVVSESANSMEGHPSAPPAGVTNLTAQRQADGVHLSWTAVDEPMVSYVVFRNGGTGTWKQVTTATAIVDTTAASGESYLYNLYARDQWGVQGPMALIEVLAQSPAPEPPSTVNAIGGDRSVKITWSPVDGVDGYNVYREDNSLVNSGLVHYEITTLTDVGLTNGSTYCYTVTSKKGGVESAQSTGACAMAQDTENPNPPTGLTVNSAVSKVDLSWNVSTSTDAAYQEVYRNGTWMAELPKGQAAWTDNTVALDGTEYTYWIKVVDDDDLASLSATVTARPHDGLAPAAPTNLQAVAGNGTVALSWTASTSGDVTGYEVWRSTTAGQPGSLVYQGSNTSYSDTGLANGTTYYYTVYAVDFMNMASTGATKSATPQAPAPSDTTPPSVPTNVQASAGDQVVNLSWTASNDNVGVTGYTVYWGTGSTEPTTWTEVPVTGTSWTHSGLTNGTTYWYKVVARDGAGNRSVDSVKKWAMPQASSAPHGTHENTSSMIVYNGTWNLLNGSVHSGGSASYSWATGASAALAFTGTSIAWIGYKSPYYGLVDVYLDGVWVETVDLYVATTEYRRTLFTATSLDPGVHTIRIVRTGRKNPAAGDATISLDAFVVTP